MHRALAAGVVTIALLLPAAATSAADASSPGGTWHGHWTAPEGWDYEATMTLTVSDADVVTGDIDWTLRRSPRPDDKARIGLTGVEHVSGSFLPDARVVRIDGTGVDDPHHILGTDHYRLMLSDDGSVLGGITAHHGKWTAQILLQRQ